MKSEYQEAVRRGIITQSQASALTNLAQELGQLNDVADSAPSREEPLKFLNNFGSIFISLGIVFITLTLKLMLSGFTFILAILAYVGLSEWLVKQRKLVLPGIVLIISILLFAIEILPIKSFVDAILSDGDMGSYTNGLIYSCGICALTSFVYFWRYRLPFSLASGVFFVLLTTLSLLKPANITVYIWVSGIIIFFLAFILDSRDVERKTYLSDTAFWLHLLAAPMLTHGFIAMIAINAGLEESAGTVLALGFYALLMLAALFTDRRATLLASLVYFIVASNQLLGSGGMLGILEIFLLIGIALLVLGGLWYTLRRMIFGWLEGTAIGRLVPSFAKDD